MNSRQFWNSHQRHKFLRAVASRDIWKFWSLRNGISRGFKRYFPLRTPCCFIRIHVHIRLGTTPLIHNIARFEPFTNLSLFKYTFNVIQNWEADVLQFYSMVLIFCQQLWQRGSQLRMANQLVVLAGYRPLLTALAVQFLANQLHAPGKLKSQ